MATDGDEMMMVVVVVVMMILLTVLTICRFQPSKHNLVDLMLRVSPPSSSNTST